MNKQLALFLAHSAELETEAQERYEELAESMREHRNIPVADFFRRMVDEAGRHLDEVAELAADMTLPDLKAWEFDWPDAEAPETTSYEALHYRMSLRQAMQLALDNERAARAYYIDYADNCEDVETAEVARSFGRGAVQFHLCGGRPRTVGLVRFASAAAHVDHVEAGRDQPRHQVRAHVPAAADNHHTCHTFLLNHCEKR